MLIVKLPNNQIDREQSPRKITLKSRTRRHRLARSTLEEIEKILVEFDVPGLPLQKSVLLIGFKQNTCYQLCKTFSSQGWDVLPERSTTLALKRFAGARFDMVLVDLDGVDNFAPLVIESFRKAEATAESSLSRMVGYGRYVMPHFRDQLQRSGIDEILSETDA